MAIGLHSIVQGRKINDWIYRGVFLSPLDYEIAIGYAGLLDLVEQEGVSPESSHPGYEARKNLAKLEELGGIREWPPPPLTEEQLD